jgi:uncharacterized membrane protein
MRSPRPTLPLAAWLCILAALAAPAPAAAGPRNKAHVDWMGALPAKHPASFADAVSGNGRVVVGWGWTRTAERSLRWVGGGAIQKLDFEGKRASVAAVSGSGAILVGSIRRPGTPDDAPLYDAFRWKKYRGIDRLPSDPLGSIATGISGDASVVCGSVAERAAIWTRGAKPTEIGPPGIASIALAISPSGLHVVGSIEIPGSEENEAFLWSADRGIRRLGFLPGHSRSVAVDVSEDGTAVVGTSLGDEVPRRAFRWTAEGGMASLAEVGDSSEAVGVSADGTRVILNADVEDERTPYLWDEALGARPLVEALAGEHGFVLRDGEVLERLTGISDDGSVLVGHGYNRRGGRGFRLTLPQR